MLLGGVLEFVYKVVAMVATWYEALTGRGVRFWRES